jgi:hypothetical protein
MNPPNQQPGSGLTRLQGFTRHQAQLRQCIRDAAALLSFALGEMLNIPWFCG